MTDVAQSYCIFHRRVLPARFPVQHRHGMAVYRPRIVATRDGEQLLCGCEHDGDHMWPDGEVVRPEPTQVPQQVH